jgi:hypothetical protein
VAQARWKVRMDLTGQLPDIKGGAQKILFLTAQAARREWIKAARQKLRSSARGYVASISQVEMGKGVATIRLRSDTPEGKLANAIEDGVAPYDLKKGLLRSSKAKKTKSGKPYIHVPFQLKTPGGGVRPPEPETMPRPIYRLASQLGIGAQVKLPKKYEDYGLKTRLSADLSRWGHYTWKVSPYQGITKVQEPGATKATYMTFRTVSKKSDPSSWIHPGFRARNIMQEASKNLDKLVPEILDSISKKGEL